MVLVCCFYECQECVPLVVAYCYFILFQQNCQTLESADFHRFVCCCSLDLLLDGVLGGVAIPYIEISQNCLASLRKLVKICG